MTFSPAQQMEFRRCTAYLRGMKVRVDADDMTPYWAAVILADKWTDKALVEAGGVDFSDKSGLSILARFEQLLRENYTGKPSAGDLTEKQRQQLNAFLGSRGIQMHKIKDDSDYWLVARIMWPSIKEYDGLEFLLHQITSMSKKARAVAKANQSKIPKQFLSDKFPETEKPSN